MEPTRKENGSFLLLTGLPRNTTYTVVSSPTVSGTFEGRSRTEGRGVGDGVRVESVEQEGGGLSPPLPVPVSVPATTVSRTPVWCRKSTHSPTFVRYPRHRSGRKKPKENLFLSFVSGVVFSLDVELNSLLQTSVDGTYMEGPVLNGKQGSRVTLWGGVSGSGSEVTHFPSSLPPRRKSISKLLEVVRGWHPWGHDSRPTCMTTPFVHPNLSDRESSPHRFVR